VCKLQTLVNELRGLLEGKTTRSEAKRLGNRLKVDWTKVDLEQLQMGIDVEAEHDSGDPQTDVIPGSGNKLAYAKIALGHLKEKRNYYTLLKKVEK